MLSKLDWSQILLFGKGLNRQVQRCIFKAKFWPDQKKWQRKQKCFYSPTLYFLYLWKNIFHENQLTSNQYQFKNKVPKFMHLN